MAHNIVTPLGPKFVHFRGSASVFSYRAFGFLRFSSLVGIILTSVWPCLVHGPFFISLLNCLVAGLSDGEVVGGGFGGCEAAINAALSDGPG